MSHEDILDDMSLSDDELLDNLADDMMLELADEDLRPSAAQDDDDIPTITPTRATPARQAAAPPMPDLSQMMSQMMPMMSQMLGGGANPLFGGPARANNALQQPKLPWDEVVRQHAPAGEADEWIATMRKDEQKQREAVASKLLLKPHSRAYRTKTSVLPNVYMEAETLLASLVNESVRAARLEHNRTWRECRDNLVSQLALSGLAKVYERTLKAQLRQRVANDPDFLADKDSGRYSNITEALFT